MSRDSEPEITPEHKAMLEKIAALIQTPLHVGLHAVQTFDTDGNFDNEEMLMKWAEACFDHALHVWNTIGEHHGLECHAATELEERARRIRYFMCMRAING